MFSTRVGYITVSTGDGRAEGTISRDGSDQPCRAGCDGHVTGPAGRDGPLVTELASGVGPVEAERE